MSGSGDKRGNSDSVRDDAKRPSVLRATDYDDDVAYVADLITKSYDVRARVLNTLDILCPGKDLDPPFTEWHIELEKPTDEKALGDLWLCVNPGENEPVAQARYNFDTNEHEDSRIAAQERAKKDQWKNCTDAFTKSSWFTNTAFPYERKPKYKAYWHCVDEVEQWVDKFNGAWNGHRDRLCARMELHTDVLSTDGAQDVRVVAAELGNITVIVEVIKGGKWKFTAYGFCIDVFSHIVTIHRFFYGSKPCHRELAKLLIRLEYPYVDGEPRTLVGMLSTWTSEFCNAGTAKFTWIKRQPHWETGYFPPRAVVQQRQI